jgi:hypothetical protein
VGAKLTLIGTFALDAKFKIIDTGPFALAAGLAGGYSRVRISETDFILLDIQVPVYASYDLADWFAVYLSPKYQVRFSGGPQHMLGSSVGVKCGRQWGFFVEGSYMKVFDANFNQAQTNAAVFFDTP